MDGSIDENFKSWDLLFAFYFGVLLHWARGRYRRRSRHKIAVTSGADASLGGPCFLVEKITEKPLGFDLAGGE